MRKLGLIALVGLVAGCGGPFGPCFGEAIEVRLAGTVVADGVPVLFESVDAVAPSNFEDFELVRRIVIDGEAMSRVVIWTASIFGQPSGVVAVFMPANLGAGQSVPLRAIDGGGWGTYPFEGNGQPDGFVSFSFGGFVPTSVQGTLTVEAVAPLRVRLVFTATDASMATRTANLTAAFSYNRSRTACT